MRMAARLEAMGQVHYQGLTRKSRGKLVWTGRGGNTIFAICLYPLADAFCHAGNGVQLERFFNAVPILFGYQDSIATPVRDKNRLMALIYRINQGKEICPYFG